MGLELDLIKIEHLKTNEQYKKWLTSLQKWSDEKTFLIAQHYPFWKDIIENQNYMTFHLLIAYENQKVISCFSFVEYKGKFGSVIHSNPYIVYGCSEIEDEDVLTLFLNKVIEYGKDNNCLTITLCTPPFKEKYNSTYIELFKPDYILENSYQYSVLDKHPFKKIEKKRRDTFKNDIKKGIKNGISIGICNDTKQWEEWYEIYKNRYQELNVLPYPKSFFLNLKNSDFWSSKTILLCAFKDEEMLGGNLYLLGNKVVDYFASAYTKESNHLNPNSIIIDSAFNYFLNKKYEMLNWQSSPVRNGGVYNYKAKWGSDEGKHLYMTKVINDIDSILSIPLEEIRPHYQGVYFLPYELWKENIN